MISLLKRLLPWPIRHQLYAHLTLLRRQWRSCMTGRSVDREGNSIPWLTFPAIDYLSGLDLSGKRVFEWGTGASTRWFRTRVKELTSVEHDKTWFDMMNGSWGDLINIPMRYVWEPIPKDYVNRLTSEQDVILIDGIEREECAKRALTFLAQGGVIILDNSQVEHMAKRVLDASGLFPIHFWGWVPVHGSVYCTSFYFAPGVLADAKTDVNPKLG